MAKVTSKRQVTLPKVIADRYRIRPGDEIAFVPAGDVIRVLPTVPSTKPDVQTRLRLFDEATARQKRRQARRGGEHTGGERGWTREDLYTRGRTG